MFLEIQGLFLKYVLVYKSKVTEAVKILLFNFKTAAFTLKPEYIL